jgi:hypothetical protein
MDATRWAESLHELGSHAGAGLERDLEGQLEMLPASHLSLLRLVNGVTVYHGMFRLFGIGRPEPYLDMVTWNEPGTWRFAWDDGMAEFWSFGETAWGDQYAYKRGLDGEWDSRVFLLEANFMRPEVLEESFEEFIENDFLRNAKEPYDSFVREAVRRHGPILPDKQWVYVPSLALGGPEDLDNILKMPWSTAMITAGDIALAVRDSRDEEWASAVTPWVDDQGRARLRVTFSS